ncbi:cAMP-dependent protein kinase catalytic subunit alpha-like [Galendromus occidentalis]|uniref:cAMP-dependent protein kinase catalytic subunit alpha-like n=1 Tax=Galendromus occidentalis TaxID=34638 RepID=A0AAJ6QWY5_9ACAR|nr:cAMP-dependent protein kinase catalytic subunit alpha-like [Galendromus occidentalis]
MSKSGSWFGNLIRSIRAEPVEGIRIQKGLDAAITDPKHVDALLPHDPEEEKRWNRQYKENLGGVHIWVDARFEANVCPREKIENFEILGHLGRGAFGHVYAVKYRVDHRLYALKVLSKAHVFQRSFVPWAISEKKMLNAVENKFIVKLHFAFKDRKNLYMVMDLASRGDLNRLRETSLPEMTVKLIIAQIILGTEYLHACKIVHRDLKPDNIFIFEDCFIKIGDLGLAKRLKGRTYSLAGTIGYMAPEVIGTAGYGIEVDWWSIGIILYKLVYLKHPFPKQGGTPKQRLAAITGTKLAFPEVIYPGSSVNDLLRGMLTLSPRFRLGYLKGGSDDIKDHEWFRNISFCEVARKAVRVELDLTPLMPVPSEVYEFLPTEKDDDILPHRFLEF